MNIVNTPNHLNVSNQGFIKFINILRNIIDANNINKKKLAISCGLTSTSINRWLKAENMPTYEALTRLASSPYVEYSAAELFAIVYEQEQKVTSVQIHTAKDAENLLRSLPESEKLEIGFWLASHLEKQNVAILAKACINNLGRI